MKAYKYYFNEVNNKMDILEFDINREFDFDHDPESNIEEENHSHNCDHESAMTTLQTINRQIQDGTLKVEKCKDCGKYFYINKKEQEWYKDMNFTLPKRCEKCRRKRKKD